MYNVYLLFDIVVMLLSQILLYKVVPTLIEDTMYMYGTGTVECHLSTLHSAKHVN